MGKAFRFGLWGGSGLVVGPNDPSIAQMNARISVEATTNNISWYELVGIREGLVMIEARNPGDGRVWDYFHTGAPDGGRTRPVFNDLRLRALWYGERRV